MNRLRIVCAIANAGIDAENCGPFIRCSGDISPAHQPAAHPVLCLLTVFRAPVFKPIARAQFKFDILLFGTGYVTAGVASVGADERRPTMIEQVDHLGFVEGNVARLR